MAKKILEKPSFRELREQSVEKLALQLAGRTDIDVPRLLREVDGWQRLRKKVPSWAAVEGLVYPPRLSLEQCSGEVCARIKQVVTAELFAKTQAGAEEKPGRMVDLTGGLGVDFAFLAPLFKEAVYVERQENLCEAARKNFTLLGLERFEVVHAEAQAVVREMEPVDFAFLDPARRDSAGRKVIGIEDCEPNLCERIPKPSGFSNSRQEKDEDSAAPEFQDLLLEKARFVLLKLSPMLDISASLRTLHNVKEVHVVGAEGECKELLVVMQGGEKGREGIPIYICVHESGHSFSFTMEEEASCKISYAETPLEFLYEPTPTILKAGAFKTVARRFALKKLHPASHLYTSAERVENFPGRMFHTVRILGFDKQALKTLRSQVGQANLSVRNFPASVEALRKKLKLKDGGQTYLFATTLASGKHVLIECVR